MFSWASHQVGELPLWQRPQYLAIFGLGIVAAQRGCLDDVPREIRRRSRTAAPAGALSVLTLILTVVATGLDPGDAFSDQRLHWAPIGLAAIAGPARSRGLGVAARHRAAASQPPADPRGRALARIAFAAYILPGPVLIGLALALRPIDLPAEIKALLLACIGAAGSCALG